MAAHQPDSAMPSLFRRCVQCPNVSPSCPTCGSGESCQLITQSCTACASTQCVKIGTLPGQLASSPSKPIGAIVGGVVGGVAALALFIFLIYWFYFRPKKNAVPQWYPPEKRDQSTLRARSLRARSVASTVLSRASNVIQIAYIPGVTVRSPPDSPNEMPPPIPGFPPASTLSSTQASSAVEQHYFMPSDLRASTWSEASSIDPRVSVTPSLARTTLYGEGAIIAPVQQASRVHPNMVSVKSGSSPSLASSTTPPIPQIPKLGNGNSPIVAKNVTARPIEIRKAGSGQRVPTLGNLAKEAAKNNNNNNNNNNTPNVSDKSPQPLLDEKEVVPQIDTSGSRLAHSHSGISDESTSATATLHSPVSTLSQQAISQGSNRTVSHTTGSNGTLNAMIAEAINRARDPRMNVRPELRRPDSGPFSDTHEVKDKS